MNELIVPSQMACADRITIKEGTPGIELMDVAGREVAKFAISIFPEVKRILIICGTGNNGGDGLIAGYYLGKSEAQPDIFVHGNSDKIAGDAALALERLENNFLVTKKPEFGEYDLIIDAIFGAGLDRDAIGETASLISEINNSGVPVLSVDLPSGIDGRTGAIRGVAIKAAATVTFFRYKPGHLLLPGRTHCGSRHLAQIGIEKNVLKKITVEAFENTPNQWRDSYPIPLVDGHKYCRGHTLVISGPVTATGAARLMAGASLRVGSGLVTVASPRDAVLVNAINLTSIMLREADTPDEVSGILTDTRFNCVALGPGLPVGSATQELVFEVLSNDRLCVLDAGALSSFAQAPQKLFEAIKAKNMSTVLTPHEGEFAHLFPEENKAVSKIDRAKLAAVASGATIVLKGPDTVVAVPDGRASIASNAPPWLATAGSGDVLAGIIAGLLAQGMSFFDAASAAVWMHGEAANLAGPGMISSDLDASLHQIISALVTKGWENLIQVPRNNC